MNKYLLAVRRLMAPADPDAAAAGGGGGGGENPPVPPVPGAGIHPSGMSDEEIEVIERKKAIKEKEKQYQEDRRSRFKKRTEEPDEEPEEEEEEEPEEEEEIDDPKPKKKKAKKKEVEEEEEEDDDDFDLFGDDDDEEDEDEEEEDEEGEEEEDDEDEEGDEDEPQNMKTLRNKVKTEGRARKRLETENVQFQAEIERLEDELKNERQKTKNLSNQNINWNQHESIIPLWDKFDKAVYDGAAQIPDMEKAQQFNQDAQAALLQRYYEASKDVSNNTERLAADRKFAEELESDYGLDLGAGLNVVRSIKNAMDIYMEIEKQTESLKDQHSNNSLALGVTEYNDMIAPVLKHTESLGHIDEEFIENNPDSVEAHVGARYGEDEKYTKKADKHKRMITEFIYGLRPLTQEEMNRVEAKATSQGMTLPEYMKRREENYNKKRMQFLNDVFYHGMAMEDFPEMKKVYDRYLKAKNKRKTAKKATSGAKTKKGVKPKSNDTDDKGRKRFPIPGDPDYVPASKRFRK